MPKELLDEVENDGKSSAEDVPSQATLRSKDEDKIESSLASSSSAPVMGAVALGGSARLTALLSTASSSSDFPQNNTSVSDSGVPSPVWALAGQIYSQYAAPRPVGDIEPPRAHLLFEGWNEDTVRSGILGMSERQLLRRLCVGRTEMASDRVSRMYRAFQHVAAGGTPEMFSPSNPSSDKCASESPPRKIAALDTAGAKKVLLCLGRAEANTRDGMALQRYDAILNGPPPTPNEPGLPGDTVAASVEVKSELEKPIIDKNESEKGSEKEKDVSIDDGKVNDTVQSLESDSKLPENGDKNVKNDSESTNNEQKPLPVSAPLAPFPGTGTVLEFFAVFGYACDLEPTGNQTIRGAASLLRMYAPGPDAIAALYSALHYVSNALDNENQPSEWRVDSSTDIYRARLGRYQHSSDLMRAAGFDELPGDVTNNSMPIFVVDSAHNHLGVPVAETLPQIAKTKLIQARSELEAELEMIDGGNSPLVSRVLREVENSFISIDNATRAANLARVLLGGRTLLRIVTNVLSSPRDSRFWRVNASSTVLVEKIRSLGESHAVRMMASIAFFRQADSFILRGTSKFDAASSVVPNFPGASSTSGAALPFFSFPSLPEETLSLLLRKRIELEETLSKIETRLDALGTPSAADLMKTPAIAAAPNPASAASGKTVDGKKKAAESLAAPVDDGGVLMSRANTISEASLVIPILVRAQLMTDPALTAGPIAAGNKAGGATGKDAKGKATANVGSALTVSATDPVYEIQLEQLRLLKQAYLRLDTRGTGCVTIADLKAAFAAEARPQKERTQEALQLWISSRDLNNDAAVSWPEFAASFAALFLAPGASPIIKSSGEPEKTAAVPAKPTSAAAASNSSAGTHAEGLNLNAAKKDAELVANALSDARRSLQAELTVLAATSVSQLQSVLRASLPPGVWKAEDGSAASLVSLPWAGPVLDVISGIGLIQLFCDRNHARSLLSGWAAHVAAVVSEPSNSTLWVFKVTTPQEDDNIHADKSLATVHQREGDMTISWEVARLPGMHHLLRGFGFEAVQDPKNQRGGVPFEFRLGGSISSSWKKLPDTQRATMSACAQIMARHAIVFEASEAADPAAVTVAVASLICGSVASLLKKLASSNALTVTAASKATTDPKSSKAAAVSAKPDPKKSAVVAASGPIPSDPIFDDLVNADLADKWKVGLETMYEYVSKVAAAPTDMSARRINSSNIHFRQRLQYLPVPISAHSIEGEAVQVAPITWEGTKTLTAVGFRETTDGSLVLPPAASVALLQARALEVRAVLPLLRAAVALSSAKEAAARSLLPPTSAPSSTVSASAAVQDAPRVPTTLLSSVFDPRTASSRRFSDTSILRGGERLADFGESLNASGIAQSLNVSNTSVASATLLAANVSATAGQVQRPTTAPSQAISHSSALSTPAQVKGKPSPSPATVQPVSAAGDKNAKALVALGPSQAGDAVASILEESTRAAQESKTRISELEKEVANLQSQVRVQQVAELVPKLKQSLAPLAGAAMAEVRTTALAAAAGLGLKLAVAAEHSETKHSETKEGEKKLTKTEEKAPAGDKKKPSAAAAKSKKPALTATPIRVSSSAPEGGHEVTVQARISDMAPETLTAEEVARSAAGEQFVPVCLQLMAGDFVSISSESGSTQAFVRKVLSSSECDRPPDQYRLVLDRGLTHSMPEGAAYVSKKDATPEMTAAFFRNEVIEMLQKSFVVDLADSACDLAEAALRSRAAENRYAHRSVTRRIPCASLLFSDVSEAPVSVTRGTKKPYTFGVATRLVASCGGEAFLFNSMPALNLTLPPGTAPLSALSTPMSLGGSQADLFAHIFDLVDFGADGALEIQNFMTRSQREPSVWSVLCSNSIAPVFPLDSTGSTSTQPTPYQIWQRLHSAVPRITEAADQDPSNLNKSPPMLSRHVFTALFRPLHTLDFMVADKPSMRLLTYAHAGNVDLLDEASVEYWGRQWDTAKAAAPLLSESQLGDIVQVFARIHSQERLFADASWTAMTSNSVVQLDKRYPLPSELLTIRSTSDLFFALDGDSPSESELLSLANEAHSERLSDARKIRRRILNSGQEDDDDDNDEDEDDDALEFAPLVDAIGRRVPQDPWKGLSFASIVQMRVRRDSALKTASSSLSLNIAAERRRIFPTPGLGRIPHVLATLRSAFSDTRLVLIRSIVDSLKGKDTPTAIEERRRSVEDRVSSIPAADFIATISRTDAGRRSLSFPLALAGGSIAPNGAGSQFVTVQSVLEQLGKGCVSGHVTWAQVVGSIRSFGGSVSPPVDSSLKASYPGASQAPSIGLLFPSLADRPPARSSLIAAPSMQSPPASLIVLDVATNLLTNSIAVLTSDGALTSYDSSSLARKWMTSALSSRAALAIKWLRETRLPFLKLLSVSAENQSPGSVKSSTNSTVSGTASSGMLLLSAVPEAQGDIVVNSSAAAYAVGVANEMDKGISSLLLDATDPTGQSLIGLTWHSDAPSSGQIIGRITPRILADTELWTQGNASGGQHKVCVSGGTPFSLLEMVYLQDSHLIVGTCVPILAGGLPGSSEANLASSIIQDSETPHQIPGTASLSWPRLMAFDALTGACTADLGPLSSAVTSGSHLLYNPDTQQVIAADYLTLGKPESVKVGVSKTATITQTSPVIKVWDFSPVLAIAARQRAAFLQAAISPDRAAAASTSLLSHTLNQTANITGYVSPAVNVDELIPQVLALPHVIMLDVMSQFVQIDVKMPKKSSFEPGSSISSLCLLPLSGLLTVAQADGSLSLWDARYTRHRMQFPPTSNTTENDFSPSDQTFNAAVCEADDARFTSLPKGCFATSVLKLNSYFAGAGLLQFPQMPKFSSSSGFDGKLIRNLPPTEVSKFPVDRVKIGLAAVPGGLHSSISSVRHPCRLQVPICDTIRAFDIASGYDELHLKMFPGAEGVKDPDREADAVLDALEGGGKVDEDSETIYAGYIYVLDDGSCIPVESPATAHLSSRALGKPLIGKIFDQRFVELTDDVYFCAAAASDISTDAYAALKRALLLRHRVARVFFIISKGVPLQSFLPALTRMVSIAPTGQRAGNSGQGTLSVPVAASPLSVITYYLAGTHDAASGGAGGAASSVTSIVEMCTPVSELKTQSQLPSSMPPFVCIPFFAAGDTSNSVLAVKGLDSDTPGSAVFEATNEARLVISKFFTTGIITALGTSASNVKIAEVALEYEDRVVRVKTDDVEVIETASRVRITSSPTDDLFSHSSPTPLVGDRVLVAVRPASVEAVLGTGGKGTLEEPRFIAERVSFPAAAILLPDAPSPSLDILLVSADTFSEATSSSSVIGGGTVQSRRLFMMWAVGVAKVDVPVPLFDVDLPRPSLRAIDEGFQRFASTILLRQQTAWAGARAVSLRREAVRASIITDRSIALYGAASSGRGTGSTAQALFRAASTVGVNEFDPAVPLLRSALGYVWGLVVLQQQSAEGFSGLSDQRVKVIYFLSALVAAAWHYPWFRFSLKPLLSQSLNSHQFRSGGEQYSGSLSLFAVASACVPIFKRNLLAETGRRSKDGEGDLKEEANVKVTFGNVLDAAAKTLRETLTIDSLLGVLEYLRDAGAGDGITESEHMVQSLIRRQALSWDPQHMLSSGMADGATVDALTNAYVVPTPLDQFLPAEAAFLLVNSPTVVSVTEPSLLVLAKAFADPVAAMKTTLQTMLSRSTGLHLLALQPEPVADTENRVLDGIDDDVQVLDDDALGPLARLGRAEIAAAEQLSGTAFTLLTAHGRLVSLMSAVLSDAVVPSYAHSMQQALAQAASKTLSSQKLKKRTRDGSKQLSARMQANVAAEARLERAQGEQSRLKAISQSLMERIHDLLERAAVSCSPMSGVDTVWLGRFLAACDEFASLVESAASSEYIPDESETPEVAEASRALEQSRVHSQLLFLLSQGAVEALVQCAILHTGYAIKLPCVPRKTSGSVVKAMVSVIERLTVGVLEENDYAAHDGVDSTRIAAKRLSPHLPRLLRALVYLATGRFDGISDDIAADTTTTAPVLHPIDSKMLQPAYVEIASQFTMPLIQKLFGVDGRGSMSIPSVKRYVSASGNASSLARGPAMTTQKDKALESKSETALADVGSPLVPLAKAPIVAGYASSFLPGLQRAAGADDMILKASKSSSASQRRIVSWSFEESVEQFAKRFMPSRGVAIAASSQDGSEDVTHGATAAGILAMATTGSPHLISSFCTFRRCAAYWRQLPLCLAALAKLHQGVPDPLLDIGGGAGDVAIAGASGQTLGVAAHARLMERVSARRQAMSRFKLVLRPPSALAAMSPSLATEYQGGDAEDSVGSDDVVCSDIDRALLVNDLQIHDISVALMFDPDHEVRLSSFRAVRAVVLAVAGPALAARSAMTGNSAEAIDLTAELAAAGGGASSASSFASRARARRWHDLLLRFSQSDCVVAASRRALVYIQGVTGPKPGNASNELYEIVSHAVDIFAAQAVMRTALPAAWRMCGVLGILARLAKMGLPRTVVEKNKSKKEPEKKKSGLSTMAATAVSADKGYADIVLRQICTDHGNEAMLTLARFDQAVHQWAENATANDTAAQELLQDTSGTWPSVCDSLRRGLAALRGAGLLETLAAAAQVTDPGARQAFLDSQLAASASTALGRLAAQAGSIRRALLLEMERVSRGRPSPPGQSLSLNEAVGVIWELTEAAWSSIMCTPPFHSSRGPIQAFVQSVISLSVVCARKGPVYFSLFLGCPPLGDPAAGAFPWRGLLILCRMIADTIHIRTHEADFGRFLQNRALLLLGDALNVALDRVSLPTEASDQSTDKLASQRAAVDRQYSFTLLAQAGDAGIVEAFASNISSHARLFNIAHATEIAAANIHLFASQGQTLALGIRGRSLVWTAILRCALLRPFADSAIPPGAVSQLSMLIAHKICESNVFRVVFEDMLTSTLLIDSTGGLPPVMSPYGSTYPLRTEGASFIYCAGVLMLQSNSVETSSVDALHTNGIENAALDMTSAAVTVFQSTLQTNSRNFGSASTSSSSPLKILQDHVARITASDGIVSSERTRLWNKRDIALGPTVPVVLHGLLMCVSKDEHLRSSLDEIGIPLEAIIWYRAAHRLFVVVAAAASDVSMSTSGHRKRYAKAEEDATAAWSLWRNSKLGSAPRSGETEVTRAISKGTPVAPPPLPAASSSARAALTGRFSSSSAGDSNAVSGVDTIAQQDATTVSRQLVTPARPPSVPTKMTGTDRSVLRPASATQQQSSSSASPGTNISNDLMSTASRRMKKRDSSDSGNATNETPTKVVSQREAVAATADVLAKLGEAVIDVKGAFDAAARPTGSKSEVKIQVNGNALGSALRSLGLDVTPDFIDRLVAEGFVDAGVSATATFSQFLRAVGRIMQLLKLDVLPVTADKLASEQAAASKAEVDVSISSITPSQSQSASVVHSQDWSSGNLFRADIARRLTLPPVPVPKELLRSIFERFATTRNAAPGSSSNATVRGITFSAWTAALAGAGVPVAPSEARELFRFLHLPLGEIVQMAHLREAYLAIAGFRFLVMTGLMREGSDMHTVVMGGQNASRGDDDDDDAVSDVSDDVHDEDSIEKLNFSSEGKEV